MVTTRAGYDLEFLGYRPDVDAHQFEYDPEATPSSMAIVAALSTVLDVAPRTLDPLQRTVDVEALDTLMTERDAGNDPIEVTLRLADHVVTVGSDGGVDIVPGDAGTGDPDSIDGHR